MRATLIPSLSLLLSGCVAMTTSGTREAVLFTDEEQAPVENAQAVLKPYGDLPLSMEFRCPPRVATVSTSYVVPLPPVLPAGVASRTVSYLHVTMPEGLDDALAQSRIVTRQGTALQLAEARKSSRIDSNQGTVETTFTLDKECEALNGARLEVASIFYSNKTYPASHAHLQFDAKITAGIGWWPPALFNRGHPISGSSDNLEMR